MFTLKEKKYINLLSFLYLSPYSTLSTLLILAVCRIRVKFGLVHQETFRSSVERAPAVCMGGHGFDSRRGLRFSLYHAHDMMIYTSFFFANELTNYYFFFIY